MNSPCRVSAFLCGVSDYSFISQGAARIDANWVTDNGVILIRDVPGILFLSEVCGYSVEQVANKML